MDEEEFRIISPSIRAIRRQKNFTQITGVSLQVRPDRARFGFKTQDVCHLILPSEFTIQSFHFGVGYQVNLQADVVLL